MKNILKCLCLLLVLTSTAFADSYSTTQDFYDWYLKSGMKHRDNFAQAKRFFTPELHGMLTKGFARTPDSGWFVDFDPFINAQMDAKKVSVGKPKTVGNDLDMVQVNPLFDFNRDGNLVEGPPIKVFLSWHEKGYKIANIVYPGDGEVKSWNLRQYLRDGLGQNAAHQGEDPSTMMSPEEEASENQAANLFASLQGTWVHKATSKTADGAAEPVTGVVIKWTFQEGGRVEFQQKVGQGKNRLRVTDYILEGETILMGGGAAKYTVVKSMGDKMIWKNHRLGDFYHVVRE